MENTKDANPGVEEAQEAKVEEVKVEEEAPAQEGEDIEDNASDDTEDLTDEQILEKVATCKEEGNGFFKGAKLMEALGKYREASMLLEDLSDGDSEVAKDTTKRIYLNISTVLNKLEKWPELISAATKAIEIEDNNVKALYLRAIGSRHTKDFDTAVSDIKNAIKASPKEKFLRKEFELIKSEKKKYYSSQEGVFAKAFSSGLYNEKKDPVIKNVESSLPKYNPKNPKVFMDIKIGDNESEKIIFELFQDRTPLTADNFKCICTGEKSTEEQELNYKGNKFHRIIKNFMAQGGDITMGNGTGGHSIYGRNFDDEQVWLPHSEKGLLSMANAGPNTNGSQFFITFVETPHLNEKHTVFGRVISGWDVVKKMEEVETGESDVPKTDVLIESCGEYTDEIAEEELTLTKE